MRTHIALLLCIILCLCAAPPAKALDGIFMANVNEAEWNAENACWVERHYIAAADEFSAFVYTTHAEEYERDGVRAPLVCEAYIGSNESERITLTLDENWLIGIQTAVHLVNAELIIGESATAVNYGSIYIESGSTLTVNGTLENEAIEYVSGEFRLNCGIYIRDGGTLNALSGKYTGDGKLHKSANGTALGTEQGDALRFSNGQELSALLNQCGEYAALYASGAVTLDSVFTLPYGAEIVIDGGNSLTLAPGASLECTGNIWVNGGALTVSDGASITFGSENARIWANAEAGSAVSGQGLDSITARYTRQSINNSQTDMDAAIGGAYSDEIIHIIDVNTDVSINQAWDISENMLIHVNGGARLTLNAAVTLRGVLHVYSGAELNICAALTNEAYGSIAGVERGLCVFAGGMATLGSGGEYTGDGTRRVYGSMDGFCHAETEAELNAALASGADTVYVSQDTAITVNGAVSIPRGVTLTLLSGARLNVADGALLVNMGAIELSETAALHIVNGAQYIRGGAEKFRGTVTGLDAQPRLFNTTTARTVGLFTDVSAEYAPLCTDAVRIFENMQLCYALSIGKSIAGMDVSLEDGSGLSAQWSITDGGAAITLLGSGSETEEQICLNIAFTDGTAGRYCFVIRLSATEGAYRLGDIDRSGRIDVRDAVLLCIKIAQGDADADINGDGRLNIADVAALCRIIFQG